MPRVAGRPRGGPPPPRRRPPPTRRTRDVPRAWPSSRAQESRLPVTASLSNCPAGCNHRPRNRVIRTCFIAETGTARAALRRRKSRSAEAFPTCVITCTVVHRNCGTAIMKNITVSVDEETHRLARIRAAELDTSVSALVRGLSQRTGMRAARGDAARTPPQAHERSVRGDPRHAERLQIVGKRTA